MLGASPSAACWAIWAACSAAASACCWRLGQLVAVRTGLRRGLFGFGGLVELLGGVFEGLGHVGHALIGLFGLLGLRGLLALLGGLFEACWAASRGWAASALPALAWASIWGICCSAMAWAIWANCSASACRRPARLLLRFRLLQPWLGLAGRRLRLGRRLDGLRRYRRRLLPAPSEGFGKFSAA